MERVTGTVDRTWTKMKSTRYGDKNLHYIEVNGKTVSTGFKKHFSDGEQVDIMVKFNYGELQYQPDATVSGQSNVTKGNFSKSGGSNYSKGKFPIDPHDGQISIIRQSSMARAAELVRDMVDRNILEIKDEQEYLKKVIELALVVTDFASGQDIMKMQAALQGNGS